MPIYEFECKKCNTEYEDYVASHDPTGKYKTVSCPKCKSKRKTKLVSLVKHSFVNPIGTDKWNSEDQGHDYRYKHNQPNVAAQREMAEKMSHMGSNPYSEIDDISSGKNFD